MKKKELKRQFLKYLENGIGLNKSASLLAHEIEPEVYSQKESKEYTTGEHRKRQMIRYKAIKIILRERRKRNAYNNV